MTKFFSRYSIEFTLFVTGTVGMVLEIVGSRLLAPYFGNSIFIWTGLIGVILGFLSLGYFLGGRLADKTANHAGLNSLLFFAAVSVFFVFVFDKVLLPQIYWAGDIRFISVLISILLFAAPSTFLGMITPYATRLLIKEVNNAGAIIGRAYAVSTFGSIFGTFCAGFILITLVGSEKIVLWLSLVLTVTSIFYLQKKSKNKLIIAVIFILLNLSLLIFKPNNKIVDIDTAYDRYQIIDVTATANTRPMRYLTRTHASAESGIYTDINDDLVFDYTKFYRLAGLFNSAPKNSLVIGGGAMTQPVDILRRYPESHVDVVEIDRQLSQISKDYFGYVDTPNISINIGDGRVFLNGNKKKYDFIFLDAFKSNESIPFQLTTKESLEKCSESMEPNGITFANIISSLDGSTSKFLNSEYLTFSAVFPKVYLFAVTKPLDSKLVQNYIMIGAKNKDTVLPTTTDVELNRYLKNNISSDSRLGKGGMILTDDFAPVEQQLIGL